eukprot:CAMPEP_0201548976 /NCGR_PEP_ID=MMETSP0173_2-20130828/5460_1 /ASSEMBLY_ACC=CAM_ASM_000268 /TAXON_ID=218659 /ORGANISM="Vexillifera sp., Strain DIVA3 564/2" /LENGTH=294 /DNA_ID=CAMNT_0047958501 /DNA_START=28 /DNA_END=912 /DNA_ORIENTATION=-
MANFNDHPDWSIRLEEMADDIIHHQPHLIALQETRFNPEATSVRETFQDMAEQLLFTLNKKNAYIDANLVTQPYMYYQSQGAITSNYHYPLPTKINPFFNGSVFWEGISIISVFDIEETGSRFLKMSATCNDKNRRGTQFISVSLSNLSTMLFFNTHFGLSSDCQLENAMQTAHYIESMIAAQLNQTSSSSSSSSPFVMLVGDLNATPNNPSIDALRSKAHLTDEWAFLHPNQTGYTYKSPSPFKRIDYHWSNPSLLKHLVSIEQTLASPDPLGIYASDHIGLVSTYNIQVRQG